MDLKIKSNLLTDMFNLTGDEIYLCTMIQFPPFPENLKSNNYMENGTYCCMFILIKLY